MGTAQQTSPVEPLPQPHILRRLKTRWKIVALLLVHIIASGVAGTIRFARRSYQFNYPPPQPCTCQETKTKMFDMTITGERLREFGKGFRPAGYFDFGPAGLFTPFIHFLLGWDVYKQDAEVEGIVSSLFVADEDGDIHLQLALPVKFQQFGQRPSHPEDLKTPYPLTVEIDKWARPQFQKIICGVAIGDTVVVRGRWVYDRWHDHMEIHPAYDIVIKKHGTRHRCSH